MDNTSGIQVVENETNESEIDLGDLFRFYLSKIIWIILAVVIGTGIAGAITKFAIEPKYTATAKIYMVSSATGSVVDLTDLNLGTSLSNDYIELIKTRPIIESVISDLDLDYTYRDVINMLNLSVVTGTRIINISVTSEDPEEAMKIANELARKTEQQIPVLMDTPKPNIAERAILPTVQSSPSLTRNAVIGGLIFLVALIIILTIIHLKDDTFKSAEDVEKYLGVLPLTTVPECQINGMESENNKKHGKSAGKTKRK